jgi:hypothetical protein
MLPLMERLYSDQTQIERILGALGFSAALLGLTKRRCLSDSGAPGQISREAPAQRRPDRLNRRVGLEQASLSQELRLPWGPGSARRLVST